MSRSRVAPSKAFTFRQTFVVGRHEAVVLPERGYKIHRRGLCVSRRQRTNNRDIGPLRRRDSFAKGASPQFAKTAMAPAEMRARPAVTASRNAITG